ncbi:MAG: hypothetical protein KAJ48_07935 [Elusimicrobiales bacterium]|nr:hypothetical protein [Elusimicrobiales bacterium]
MPGRNEKAATAVLEEREYLEKNAMNRECWELNTVWWPIYEIQKGKQIEIGRFILCSRRFKPEMPYELKDKLSILEKGNYQVMGKMGCKNCRYEVSDKWEKSIRISKETSYDGHQEIKKPISRITRAEILPQIEAYIEAGNWGLDFIIERKRTEIIEPELEEIPF